MFEIWNFFREAFLGYGNYLLKEIRTPSWDNYFYALLVISIGVWGLEIIFPWRKKQKIFRKDFWLDAFYMFFNFFLFNLIAFVALSKATEQLFLQGLSYLSLDLESLCLFEINKYPTLVRLVLFFLITDLVQWATHVMLHRYEWLWNFHKVHHSVKEMGFAAHLRYHWMETVVYRTTLYIPLALIGGFAIDDVVWVHLLALTIGHLNHANINLDYGILKYVFNNPSMHIWHHAKELPAAHKNGVNFGISLSVWDYIFKTNYIPASGRDLKLGFKGDEQFPSDFLQQETYPLTIKKSVNSIS